MKLSVVCVAVIAVLCIQYVAGDNYMHSPRGSNNRLNEQSADRDNADRLFDSQNNNRGGYNVGVKTTNTFPQDPTLADQGPDATYSLNMPYADMQYQMVYYEGSITQVEWTTQHACGGNEQNDPQKINCNMVLQYMCNTDPLQVSDPAMQVVLRDGLNTQTPDAPTSYTDVSANNAQRGHHESEAYYYECTRRHNNYGLFHADQNLNGQTAQFTRQNTNGNQEGLECPEERDYYPYWGPSPWRDIAYLTDRATPAWCATILAQSQNTATVYKCTAPTVAGRTDTVLNPITQAKCLAAGGTWQPFAKGISTMDCIAAQWGRDNHLGNGRFGQMHDYNWTMPSVVTGSDNTQLAFYGTAGMAKCVLRLRYNLSTDDYDPWNINSTADNNPTTGVVSPVQENPYVDVGADLQGLRLAINTNQFGRTFQDRSHVFYIAKRPTAFGATTKIVNLSVRGKRGNIVQTYPSMEYDFQPNRLQVSPNDLVHIQWTGSNTHNNGNPAGDGQAGDAGEGNGGTDRHNFAQMLNLDDNYPLPLDKYPDNIWASSQCWDLGANSIDSLSCALIMATSGQYRTVAAASADTTGFDPLLNNAPASLVGGIVMKFQTGEYNYMCTRNNNFSNRSQKGKLIVA